MKLRALILAAAVVVVVAAPPSRTATLPPGNAAQQWEKIAEDTAVGAGAFQGEAFLYIAYVSAAMDGAVNPGERRSPRSAGATRAAPIFVTKFPPRIVSRMTLLKSLMRPSPSFSTTLPTKPSTTTTSAAL